MKTSASFDSREDEKEAMRKRRDGAFLYACNNTKGEEKELKNAIMFSIPILVCTCVPHICQTLYNFLLPAFINGYVHTNK